MSKRPWFTPEEDRKLRELWVSGRTARLVAKRLGRSREGVHKRAKALGLVGLRFVRVASTPRDVFIFRSGV